MQKQTTHQEVEKGYVSDAKVKVKTGRHPKSFQEEDHPAKAFNHYIRNSYYEKRVHHLDGPGGSYEGL